jgi:hypothetical protein
VVTSNWWNDVVQWLDLDNILSDKKKL